MKRLLTKTLLFVLPILALFIFPFYVLCMSGELTPIGRIVALQTRNARPYMIVQAYSDDWGYIKLAETRKVRPEILTLGTSRVMQWRTAYFRDRFYNAAKAIASPEHLVKFLEHIPENESPRVIIVGLDANFFNPNWVWYSSEGIYDKPNDWTGWANIFLQHWFSVYVDYFKGKFGLRDVNEDQKHGFKQIGLYARAQDSGYLNDGSFLYLRHILARPYRHVENARRTRKDVLKFIRNGDDIYVPGKEVSRKSLQAIEKFLQEAKRRNIHVIAYVPPLAPFAYEEISKHPDEYVYLAKIEPAAKPLFEKYGFSFFDFLDSRKLGGADSYYVDDLHDTGEITLHLIEKIAQQEPVLKKEVVPGLSKMEHEGMIKVSLAGSAGNHSPAA